MLENLRPACDADGHRITKNTCDEIVSALRDIVDTYEKGGDEMIGCGLTNGHFRRGRSALNLFDSKY